VRRDGSSSLAYAFLCPRYAAHCAGQGDICYSPFLLDINCQKLTIHFLNAVIGSPFNYSLHHPLRISSNANVLTRRHERFIPHLISLRLSISYLPRTRSFSNGLYSNHSTAPRPFCGLLDNFLLWSLLSPQYELLVVIPALVFFGLLQYLTHHTIITTISYLLSVAIFLYLFTLRS
jgi:hypothetical protein